MKKEKTFAFGVKFRNLPDTLFTPDLVFTEIIQDHVYLNIGRYFNK